MIEVVRETARGQRHEYSTPKLIKNISDDEIYKKAVLSKQGFSGISKTQRLLNFLFPTPPWSLPEMMFLQNENFKRRRMGPIAVCSNEYGPISAWFTVRTVLMNLALLLIILFAFVFFPVHDVIMEPSYWWECALQCSIFWTGQL